ncbi:MAG: hypothetical protein H6Q59_459 [Firmicutes bacterium]|nr:hypothetical protein [Bacillota bacterium]
MFRDQQDFNRFMTSYNRYFQDFYKEPQWLPGKKIGLMCSVSVRTVHFGISGDHKPDEFL